eukprot:Ihof_evm1s975 gene=Ihof_evmTU1s975
MFSVRIFSLCALATVASAVPVVYTGMSCPFIVKDTCTMKPPAGYDACYPVTFGECIAAPSKYVHFWDITYYDPTTDIITFQRFIDSKCQIKAEAWSHPPPSGRPGDCIGPIAKALHIIEAYVKIT